jgi:hypothetical protein
MAHFFISGYFPGSLFTLSPDGVLSPQRKWSAMKSLQTVARNLNIFAILTISLRDEAGTELAHAQF